MICWMETGLVSPVNAFAETCTVHDVQLKSAG